MKTQFTKVEFRQFKGDYANGKISYDDALLEVNLRYSDGDDIDNIMTALYHAKLNAQRPRQPEAGKVVKFSADEAPAPKSGRQGKSPIAWTAEELCPEPQYIDTTEPTEEPDTEEPAYYHATITIDGKPITRRYLSWSEVKKLLASLRLDIKRNRARLNVVKYTRTPLKINDIVTFDLQLDHDDWQEVDGQVVGCFDGNALVVLDANEPTIIVPLHKINAVNYEAARNTTWSV